MPLFSTPSPEEEEEEVKSLVPEHLRDTFLRRLRAGGALGLNRTPQRTRDGVAMFSHPDPEFSRDVETRVSRPVEGIDAGAGLSAATGIAGAGVTQLAGHALNLLSSTWNVPESIGPMLVEKGREADAQYRDMMNMWVANASGKDLTGDPAGPKDTMGARALAASTMTVVPDLVGPAAGKALKVGTSAVRKGAGKIAKKVAMHQMDEAGLSIWPDHLRQGVN